MTAHPDDGIYRTELERAWEGGWNLYVDSRLVAATDQHLHPEPAQDWARSEMGEGVTFENGLVAEPAWSGYWVAGPVWTYEEWDASRAAVPNTEATPDWEFDPAKYADDDVDAL